MPSCPNRYNCSDHPKPEACPGLFAKTTVVACMIFVAIFGSSVPTTSAIGSILIAGSVRHGDVPHVSLFPRDLLNSPAAKGSMSSLPTLRVGLIAQMICIMVKIMQIV